MTIREAYRLALVLMARGWLIDTIGLVENSGPIAPRYTVEAYYDGILTPFERVETPPQIEAQEKRIHARHSVYEDGILIPFERVETAYPQTLEDVGMSERDFTDDTIFTRIWREHR